MSKAAVASPPQALTAEALRAALPFPTDPDFAEEVVEDFRSEELPGVEEEDLVAVLAEFWRFAEERWGEKPALRIRRAKGEGGRDLGSDLLEIVQPDAPFLVDTVMGEAADAGAEVKAMFHPVIERRHGRTRERRSLIQVWLAPRARERGRLLLERIREALADVRVAVADFPAMRALMARTIAELAAAAPGDQAHLAEDLAFLAWMDKGHFVFLGARSYDYPRTSEGGYAAEEPLVQPEGSLGVLRDPSRRVLRRANEPAVLSAALRAHLELAEPVVIAKSNLRSRVHRRVMMDYVGVRRYGPDKKPYGEVRFVGLFTAAAYDEPARDTPLLRRKIAQVMERTGFSKGGHNAVRLTNILETFPRDELFQMRAEELFTTAVDILHLYDRPRIKLFLRRDPFGRFVSVLLFVPRERYDSRLRARAGDMLAKAFRGSLAAYYPSYTDAPLARVHYIIGLSPRRHPAPDLASLEAEIAAAARTWSDELEDAASPQSGGAALFAKWREAFPVAYRERWDAAEALADIAVMDGLSGGEVAVRAFRQAGDSTLRFRLKLYRRGEAPVPLAKVLPILDSMGLSALVEEGFELGPLLPSGERDRIWIHEFLLEDERGERLVFSEIKDPFEEAFLAVWRGQAESDGFNRLVLELSLGWREAALVRALARWRGQSGLDPSAAVQASAAAENPEVVRPILGLFRTKFDPASGLDLADRRAAASDIEGQIETALQNVASLDADRALRRMAGAVTAMTRTNFYQGSETEPARAHISFKIASGEVAELPAPRPFAEIFVASPRVEGVHLRMGPVARGGLRWSDRRDDFRTEILGLVKAQQVKNAVIVPVGAKGGFFPKLLPRGADAKSIRAEAVGAYQVFLRGLLDLTDNLDGQGRVAHPPGLVVHDGQDPYLVVAADKGTASFSDIANEVAAEFGYWLGDAFASGGSAGFDHKAMAITALGAWEAVKRHFRELGKDIQREDFTVVGVGDMSGDVFGNGMLLSEHIKLLAAFDHRHIFLDPAPDPAASFAERKRLFELTSSSWDDYDRAAISLGGGVWPRTLKSIPISEEARALLDLKVEAATPAEIICATLKARCELLYLGGIGTYVKARSESQLEVGDKANDPVRVDGADLRCKVVGEGANLGFTQAGRIEYARAGGRIDTDAIDNSAGVDTSDHEVNIKILTGAAIQAGSLKRAKRDPLLHAMTGEVAALVLSHNTAQTLALSLLEEGAAEDLEAEAAFMVHLEARNRLDRALEGLPDAVELARVAAAEEGLTRPELAVLLAYGKIDLYEDLVASAAPDDPAFDEILEAYFPPELARFSSEIARHRLRREIIATSLANDAVNLCGPTFASRLMASAGCDVAAFAIAFEAARQSLRFSDAWRRVERLEGRASAEGQMALFRELAYVLRGKTYWLARRATREGSDVAALVAAYRPAVDQLKKLIPQVLSPFEQKAAVRRAAVWIKAGAPKDIAHAIALFRPLTLASILSDLAKAKGWPFAEAAFLYHRVGGTLGFDRLRWAAGSRKAGDPFERLAVRRLVEDMLAEQAALAGAVMDFAEPPKGGDPARSAAAAVHAWSISRAGAVKAGRKSLEEIERAAGGWSFAKLTIANAALRELADGRG